MKYLSLFSGIGGFEIGIQQAYEKKLLDNKSKTTKLQTEQNKCSNNSDIIQRTPTCIGYSEIDKYAIQVYEKHFNHKNYGDIKKIKPEDLPDFELLVGGFPCQSFSIAGKRQGFKDTQGTLFFEISRVIKQKQPRILLLENVKGLLSHDKGQTFFTIISTLDELGYDLQWQVLNSKNFNVPQNRERVFIVGHLRGTSRPEVFPIGGENPKSCVEIGSIKAISEHDILKRCYSTDGLSPVLNTCGGGNTEGKFAIPVLTPDRPEKRQNGRRFKENGEPSFTLTAQDKHGIYDGAKIRRLTPKECEKLQGFPDDWTEHGIDEKGNEIKISDSQRYKILGNAVTVNVITAIVKKLLCT